MAGVLPQTRDVIGEEADRLPGGEPQAEEAEDVWATPGHLGQRARLEVPTVTDGRCPEDEVRL